METPAALLRAAGAALSGRASARRFWRAARAGYPVILGPLPQEPLGLRTSYSADFLYTLTTDRVRMEAFRRAIARCRARRVLEIGCGPWAPLTEMAFRDGGAECVVAVEATHAHAEAARRRLSARGFEERATVLAGRACDLETELLRPDSERPDLIVAELLGYTASEEGAPAALADLQRRLGPGIPVVPTAARSFIAPVAPLALSWLDLLRNWLLHHSWPSPRRLLPGRLYDCRGLPAALQLAEGQVFEDYDFASAALGDRLEQQRELHFSLPPGAEIGGLLIWMQTDVAEGISIDTRKDETSWNHYLLHLAPFRVGTSGGLSVRTSVDARSEAVSYEFEVDGARYRTHG
eukprot:TRINITY_DN2312_c3_g1_i1.p1 TRINITY_DN2312_c3_g1~~TRINITY_DN2312_c3_g1_i1.p1  ORF type:complete len:384 (-),score=83.09 TRINITY_DN2312_c3_g1_i1:7-1056(-)